MCLLHTLGTHLLSWELTCARTRTQIHTHAHTRSHVRTHTHTCAQGLQDVSEPLVARVLSRDLPSSHGLFLGNSMPIRDMDMYAGGCARVHAHKNHATCACPFCPLPLCCHSLMLLEFRCPPDPRTCLLAFVRCC